MTVTEANKSVQNMATALTYKEGRYSNKSNYGFYSFDGDYWFDSIKKDQKTWDNLQKENENPTNKKSLFF